jgi:hypothetical protein
MLAGRQVVRGYDRSEADDGPVVILAIAARTVGEGEAVRLGVERAVIRVVAMKADGGSSSILSLPKYHARLEMHRTSERR